jgi:predicted DNA-binding transcriptional regulator AlpA
MASLATPEQVAEWLQIKPERLSKLRKTGRGPRAIKVGRAVRYAWPDVHAWANAQREPGNG